MSAIPIGPSKWMCLALVADAVHGDWAEAVSVRVMFPAVLSAWLGK